MSSGIACGGGLHLRWAFRPVSLGLALRGELSLGLGVTYLVPLLVPYGRRGSMQGII